jgi:monofunctional biosynthetic peptidoglycan transglycosylase
VEKDATRPEPAHPSDSPAAEEFETALLPDEADAIEHAHFDMLERETTQPVRWPGRREAPVDAPQPEEPAAAIDHPEPETPPPRAFEPAPFTVLRPMDRPIPTYPTSQTGVRAEPAPETVQKSKPEPPAPVAERGPTFTAAEPPPHAADVPSPIETSEPKPVAEPAEPAPIAAPVEFAPPEPEPPLTPTYYEPPAAPAEPVAPPGAPATEPKHEIEPSVEFHPAPPQQHHDAPPPPAASIPPPAPELEFVPELALALRSEPPPTPSSPPPFGQRAAEPSFTLDPPRRAQHYELRTAPAIDTAPTFTAASAPLTAYEHNPAQPAEVGRAPPPASSWRDLANRAVRAAVLIFVGWFLAVLLLIVAYRFINPPFSMLMAQQFLTGTSINNDWVSIDRISPNLSRAVIASEDSRFCQHWGVDFIEAANAIRRASDGYPRGASTITMQVAKNLFLVPTKSYIRKIVEIPLTFAIEGLWPKRRILEIYLNIVEWGPGIFGAEAASHAHFGRPAAALTSRQAAQLAAVLPNPIVRDAGDPGPRTANKASIIQARAARAREASACVENRR